MLATVVCMTGCATVPTVSIDDECRNGSTLRDGIKRWGLTPGESNNLPDEWLELGEVTGRVSEIEPGRVLFSADGVEIEFVDGPTDASCVPWAEPFDAGPDG